MGAHEVSQSQRGNIHSSTNARNMDGARYRRPRSDAKRSSHARPSVTMAMLRRQQGCEARDDGLWRRRLSDFVLSLASPSALPCPDASPAFNVQFSKQAGDGHYLAFGTEWGKLVVTDTRVEAAVQRDDNGPVGSGRGSLQSSSSILHHGTTYDHHHNATAAPNLSVRPGGRSGTTTSVPTGMTTYGGRGVGQPTVVAEWQALSNCVFDVEWMQGDRLIALGCGDNMCRVQDTETQTEVCVLKGHHGSVKSVAANPLQQCVMLTGSRDGSFALWDMRLLHRDAPDGRGFHSTEAIRHEAAFECGEAAGGLEPLGATSTSSVILPVEQVIEAHFQGNNARRKRPRSYSGFGSYDHAHGHYPGRGASPLPRETCSARLSPVYNSNYSVTAVEWMGDGQKFITAGQDGLVKLWDTRHALRPLLSLTPASSRPRHSSVSNMSMMSNKHSYAKDKPVLHEVPPISVSTSNALPGSSGRKKRRGAERGGGAGGIRGGGVLAREESESGRPYGVSSVHACDDGSRVAVCTVKNKISVYMYTAGTLVPRGVFTGNTNTSSYYIKAKLSPDGSLLASGSPGDAVCLWEVDSPGAPIARLEGHVNEVTGVDWCRSEALKLASCSDDETVRLWTFDPATREVLLPCRRPQIALRSRSLGSRDRCGLDAQDDVVLDTTSERGDRSHWSGGERGTSQSPEGGVTADCSDIPKNKFGRGKAYIGENARWTEAALPDGREARVTRDANRVACTTSVVVNGNATGGEGAKYWLQGPGEVDRAEAASLGCTVSRGTRGAEGVVPGAVTRGLTPSLPVLPPKGEPIAKPGDDHGSVVTDDCGGRQKRGDFCGSECGNVTRRGSTVSSSAPPSNLSADASDTLACDGENAQLDSSRLSTSVSHCASSSFPVLEQQPHIGAPHPSAQRQSFYMNESLHCDATDGITHQTQSGSEKERLKESNSPSGHNQDTNTALGVGYSARIAAGATNCIVSSIRVKSQAPCAAGQVRGAALPLEKWLMQQGLRGTATAGVAGSSGGSGGSGGDGRQKERLDGILEERARGCGRGSYS